MPIHELSKHSWIQVLSPKKMPEINFEEIWDLRPEERGKFKLMGRIIETPRWQQTYLKSYSFGGIDNEPLPLPRELKKLFKWVREWTEEDYNQVMVVWYDSGNDYIGKHSDNTKPLVRDSNILIISLGETRKFRIRSKTNNSIVMDTYFGDRDCIIMGGRFQDEFTHEIVKVNGKKGENLGRRISINMRIFSE